MFSRLGRVTTAIIAALWFMAGSQTGRVVAESSIPHAPGDPVRVLIISGQGDHDWRVSTPRLRQLLADTGRFDVRVCDVPAGLTERMLDDFDVVVNDRGTSTPGDEADHAIVKFVESGRGLVVTHGALSPRAAKHAPVDFLAIRTTESEHPIVHGLPAQFKIADALCRGLKFPSDAKVIASVTENANHGGGDVPVLLVSRLGKGRVLTCALGHDLAAMREPAFITTFARGTEWAATGGVTLPLDLGLARPGPDAVKAILITGGHDHETSFYSLFDGYKDLARIPVSSSGAAFHTDLRGKYDVVIMYDFSRDLDETGKKNLRAFVEAGKGVVVLHHALLNYQDWSWWCQEVVGGSYRLKREGDVLSSTVKDGQELFVSTIPDHPITAGMPPFRIVDETYKRMRMSARVKPLLTTDNPSSDKTLAWIGPTDGLRVVAIQLGHGHTAFDHPSYRSLVHRAILWSAGRIR